MNSQQYILSHYIKNLKNIDNVNKHLFQTHNIMTKDFPDLDMTIYYNKYSNKHKSTIELASRSVIMSRGVDKERKVICYTCPTPLYNHEATSYLNRNKDKDRSSYVCYEGSLMSVFNYNGKWYIASRRNLYSDNMVIKETKETKENDVEKQENSHQFKMFLEVLENDGYATFDDFTKELDNMYSYHFVLIHHLNENIVNYVNIFGPNYKKLCFIFSRKLDTMEEVASENIVNTFVSDNIFLPKLITDTMSNTSTDNITAQPVSEGIIIKINNMILKLQSTSYMFNKSIGSDKNMFRGFLTLYQNNTLKSFLSNESNNKFKKIVNPLNTTESFDTIGMIDALFKVITSELHNLYYLLWNDEGVHLNKEMYSMLPREYKDMLFHLRGVYFSNKTKQVDTSKETEQVLKLKDVYNFIKTTDIVLFEKFIRCRKLMLNWARLDKSDKCVLFTKTLHKCEKVYYKLSAIYTTKLFPEIMPTDVPTFN
jgi:hypothetical protein